MDEAQLEEWLQQNPWLLVYMAGLFVASITSFIYVVRRSAREFNIGRSPIRPWKIETLDFTLFICALGAWFVLSGAVILQVASAFGLNDMDGLAANILTLFAGLALQLGLLAIFLGWRQHHRRPDEGSFSPVLVTTPASLGLGFLYFLASLPIIYMVALSWQGILFLLKQLFGVEFDLPLQDPVLIFRDLRESWLVVVMILLAVVVAPVVEELVFRAGIYRYFKGRTAGWVAILISSILFGIVHGNLQSLPGLIAVGICLCITYEMTGNIKVPIFFHACFNLNSIIWILLLPPEMITG